MLVIQNLINAYIPIKTSDRNKIITSLYPLQNSPISSQIVGALDQGWVTSLGSVVGPTILIESISTAT